MRWKDLVILAAILFFALATRLWRLSVPAGFYFDEIYHISAAQLLTQGRILDAFSPLLSNQEGLPPFDWLHPPLAKYFQAAALAIWPLQAWAWRLPSVLISLLTVLLFYFLCRIVLRLFLVQIKDKAAKQISGTVSLATTGLLVVSGLFLMQSRLAMNDVFALFFELLFLLLYFHYYRLSQERQALERRSKLYLLALGISAGLALACKWTTALPYAALLLWELWRLWRFYSKPKLRAQRWRQLPFLVFSLLLTPAFIYFLTYLPFFLDGGSYPDFFRLQQTILHSHLSNPNSHPYASPALTWPLNWRPVWYWTDPSLISDGTWTSNIYLLENPLLSLYFLGGLVLILAKLLLGGKKFFSISQGERPLLYLLLILNLSSFLPLQLVERPLFLYHYLLTLPFNLLLSAYLLLKVLAPLPPAKQKAYLFNFLAWPLVFFLLYYPHWVALPVPQAFANATYFFLKSWK